MNIYAMISSQKNFTNVARGLIPDPSVDSVAVVLLLLLLEPAAASQEVGVAVEVEGGVVLEAEVDTAVADEVGVASEEVDATSLEVSKNSARERNNANTLHTYI